ncbi:DUF2945 domain-containing protein [Streptomyces sp. NPDC057307]|uniref:DUF2945 domain-containing protein n=1 Tax=Streptomyces sp. NPDC057307 TaxID=3346096 RepID=UPI0036336385
MSPWVQIPHPPRRSGFVQIRRGASEFGGTPSVCVRLVLFRLYPASRFRPDRGPRTGREPHCWAAKKVVGRDAPPVGACLRLFGLNPPGGTASTGRAREQGAPFSRRGGWWLMTKDGECKKEDSVSWRSHGQRAPGRVKKKIAERTEEAGRTVDASKDDPQYEVESTTPSNAASPACSWWRRIAPAATRPPSPANQSHPHRTSDVGVTSEDNSQGLSSGGQGVRRAWSQTVRRTSTSRTTSTCALSIQGSWVRLPFGS